MNYPKCKHNCRLKCKSIKYDYDLTNIYTYEFECGHIEEIVKEPPKIDPDEAKQLIEKWKWERIDAARWAYYRATGYWPQ